MNAAIQVQKQKKKELYTPNMSFPVAVSFIFHVAIFALATIGMPYLAKPIEPQEMSIAVEIFTPDEMSQTTKIDEPEKAEDDIPPPPDIKPVYNKSDSQPDLLTPSPPEIEEIVEPAVAEPEPEPIVEPVMEEKPVEIEPVADPHLIKEPPKPKAKPKPPTKPKPEEKPASEVKPSEPERDINSLLKSLSPDEPEEVKQSVQVAQLAEVLTTSEFVAMGEGVAPCWNVDAGMTYSDDLYVVLHVKVDQSRKVLSADILPRDAGKYNNNARFRAAAEAARRALLNESCRTLRLPADKYEQWREFYYPFDPRGMLR